MSNYEDSVFEKAQRLINGGVVDVDHLSVKAKRINSEYDPCEECSMDSLCHRGTEMCDICEEMNELSRDKFILVWNYDRLFW